MKFVFAAIITALALAATATAGAGSANLCAKNGWATAQTGSGGSFASMSECARSKEVFAPTLTSSASTVTAGQVFTLTGAGFHAASLATLAIAVTGQAPYYTFTSTTDAGGNYFVPLAFTGCATTSVGLTLTVTDGAGVHASVAVTLC
jgi:hypothetical protein